MIMLTQKSRLWELHEMLDQKELLSPQNTNSNASQSAVIQFSKNQENIDDKSAGSSQSPNSQARFSQAYCLRTTVPINIVGSTIGGRHTPTRNALRHSRMIAMTHAKRRASLTSVAQYHRLTKLMNGILVLFSMIALTLAIWILIWTKNLPFYDTPFWSGLLLLSAGVLNLIHLSCCGNEVPGMPIMWYTSICKITALAISTLAFIACLCVVVFASLHVYAINVSVCEPSQVSNLLCVCRWISSNTDDTASSNDVSTRTYTFESLNCSEVTKVLDIVLAALAVTNIIGAILIFIHVYLYKRIRHSSVYHNVDKTDSIPLACKIYRE